MLNANALHKLYVQYRNGELDDNDAISLLIIAQNQRIEELEEELKKLSLSRGVVMNGVVAGDGGINISGVTVGR
jgi:hypothetical protein